MRTVTVVLIVSIIALSLVAACGSPTLLNPPANTTEPVAGEAANNSVTETTIEQGTPTVTPPPVVEPPAPAENKTTPKPAPTPTPTPTPAPTITGCPLISVEDVAGACNKTVMPNLTMDGIICKFNWGAYQVNVTSTSASMSDYNAWVNTIPTAQDGRFKPVSLIAEYNKMKYYGWFTGSRLIIATSNNVLGCSLSRLDAVIARVDPTAKVVGEISTADKLASAVPDTGKKTVTAADIIQFLGMKWDKTVPFDGNYSGTIQYAWSSAYKLMVTLKGMPKGTYNGYLVKKTGWLVIDLGSLEETSDAYRLMYASSNDLRDHNWFVLTSMKDGKETILSETSLT